MENETEYVRRLQEVDDRSRRNEGRIKKLEADQKALLDCDCGEMAAFVCLKGDWYAVEGRRVLR